MSETTPNVQRNIVLISSRAPRSDERRAAADRELLEKLRTIQARRPRTARLFADMLNDVYRDITGGGR